jgi:hypothetical protein
MEGQKRSCIAYTNLLGLNPGIKEKIPERSAVLPWTQRKLEINRKLSGSLGDISAYKKIA